MAKTLMSTPPYHIQPNKSCFNYLFFTSWKSQIRARRNFGFKNPANFRMISIINRDNKVGRESLPLTPLVIPGLAGQRAIEGN